MAVSRAKNWAALEVLTADDLNAEFNNILNNGEDLGWPATQSKDLDGQTLIFDADGDSSVSASTDDEIDVTIANNVVATFTAAGLVIASGATVDGLSVLQLRRRAESNMVEARMNSAKISELGQTFPSAFSNF
jgi:hypothetical protein